ncbi:rhamnosyltransferase [Kandleria vitulina]|uniref:glycosyltransferase n=1 Tax=Kandleria vitulina TaxID=1630 RepID=UPI0008880F6F|nr:glycosyltransferase [Kandleria vitulina]SDL41641.1 rhamnosyltransferase [Kandleria vitulina]
MKFAAAVTLYNPTETQLRNCISYTKTFDYVFLIDNSEPSIDLSNIYLNNSKIKYIDMKGNKGLSDAFNEVLNRIDDFECDYVCTLDQDSKYFGKDIEVMKEFIVDSSLKKYYNINPNNVGIYAPVIDYGGGTHSNKLFEKRKRVITSGSFLNIKIINQLGIRYDSNYFIDRFDIDFCQQLIEKKLDIILYYKSVLYQCLGEGDNKNHSSHNLIRHYYIFRNRLYFNKKYFKPIKRYTLNFLQTLKHIIHIIIYEPNKVSKIKQLFPAIQDYYRGKMGKM